MSEVNSAAPPAWDARVSTESRVLSSAVAMQEGCYFPFIRSEIASLLPEAANRVLEIGCGQGKTLAWLKRRFPSAETVGIVNCLDGPKSCMLDVSTFGFSRHWLTKQHIMLGERELGKLPFEGASPGHELTSYSISPE